jgi:ribonuclease P protein component
MSQRLGPTERLRKRAEFERVYKQGLKAPGRYMTLFLLRNGRPLSRLGIAATRKLGGAVVRNRAKRLAREIYRRHKPQPSLDLVVIPRREFLNAELASLEAEYQSIVARRASRAPGPVPDPVRPNRQGAGDGQGPGRRRRDGAAPGTSRPDSESSR